MDGWRSRAVSAADAIGCVGSGMTLFVHGAAATPTGLLDALVARTDLQRITLYHLHTGGPAPFAAPECRERIFSVSLFAAAPVRSAIACGDADFVPIFLSDIPSLFLKRQVALDVAT